MSAKDLELGSEWLEKCHPFAVSEIALRVKLWFSFPNIRHLICCCCWSPDYEVFIPGHTEERELGVMEEYVWSLLT